MRIFLTHFHKFCLFSLVDISKRVSIVLLGNDSKSSRPFYQLDKGPFLGFEVVRTHWRRIYFSVFACWVPMGAFKLVTHSEQRLVMFGLANPSTTSELKIRVKIMLWWKNKFKTFDFFIIFYTLISSK